MIKQIWNPDLYHGKRKKKNFFEGWYFKMTSKDNLYSIALIPGIIKGKIKEDGHSFIQIIDGKNHQSYYLKLGKTHFNAETKPFSITINHNLFSLHKLSISHCDENVQIIGNLKFNNIKKWPDSKLTPGSMGFYNYLFFMECYSQVCCLNGDVEGELLVNNQAINFDGGRIYIEKNWGSKFPDHYIWIQANNFDRRQVSLSFSMGRVPLGLYRFNGFLAALQLDDEVYKFTTMNRSKIYIEHHKNILTVIIERKNLQLRIKSYYKEEDFVSIKGPIDGFMNRTIKESIISDVHVTLINTYNERILFKGMSKNAGLEFMGDLKKLQKKGRKNPLD